MKIPIIFLFNDNFRIPAGVCITSLLENAADNTFYKIYILHSGKRLNEESIESIRKLDDIYPDCQIFFLDVDDSFARGFKSGHLTIDTYYRLLIPSLFKEYDRVIYADVDMIFKSDLTEIYKSDLDGKALGAVVNLLKPRFIKGYPVFSADQYFNAGFLLMDIKEISRITNYTDLTEHLSRENFEFMDQDILNIIFRGNVKFLDIKYNFSRSLLKTASIENIDTFQNPYVIHYVGRKPWDGYITINSDKWWYYYAKSIYYDPAYYFNYINGYKNLENVMIQYKFTDKLGFNSFFNFLKKIKMHLEKVKINAYSHGKKKK